jgi:uncharacterized protein YcbK (DUF882 family)
VPGRSARTKPEPSILKSATRASLAAIFVVFGSTSVQNAIANGDTRTVSFHNTHTGEDLTVTFKKNGRYDDAALKQINHIMRDWRRNEEIAMDPRLIDLVWEVRRDIGASETTIQIICGYRAPGTNEMLRKRSRNSGVARASQHTHGRAMDFYIPGAKLDDLRAAGLRLQRGGVGFYPSSGSPFVHMDVGSIRHWPRMTHDQLARVFPDGRTVHIPSDGQPLKGYQLALADIQKRGGEVSPTSIAAAESAGGAKPARRNIFAKLFGFGKDRDEDEDAEVTQPQAAPAKPAIAPVAPLRPTPVVTETPKPVQVAAIPMPKARMAPAAPAPVQVAQAVPPTPRPAQAASIYSAASAPRPPAPIPNVAPAAENVFDARGFWRGAPDAVVPSDTKVELASADAKATGSIGPWPAPPERATPSAGEGAIGYAVPSSPKVVKQAPMGAAIPRATAVQAGAGISIATKGDAPAIAQAPAALAAPQAAATRLDNPWLRAMVLAPSVSSVTTSVYGALDMRALQPLLRRPHEAVAMTFSDDPHGGMRSDRFSGSAVVFVATTTFTGRTAALR